MVALEEEKFETAGRGGARLALRLPDVARGGVGSAPLGFVGDGLRELSTHRGVTVGKTEEGLCDNHRKRLVAIERVEPDAGNTALVVHVGSDVELEEIRDRTDFGQSRRPHAAHGEGHDAEPTGAVEGVGVESGREGALDDLALDGPMEEEQVFPPLIHDGAEPGRRMARALALGGRRETHAKSS